MVQYLDHSFAALADPTRRGVIRHLARSDATISDLAGRFGMTLTGMKKHIGVLERAGFVATHKRGRVRTCRLGPHRLEAEAAWIEDYNRMWEERFATLDSLLEQMTKEESDD
jgi:DNA-binding transcriptional ArsR family regulator